MPESDSGRNQPLRIRARLMPESDSGRNKPLRYHGPPSCRSPTQVRNQPLRIRARLQSGRNSRTKENRASAPAHSPTAASSFVSLIPEVRPNPPNQPLRIRARLQSGRNSRTKENRASAPAYSPTAASSFVSLIPEVRPNPPNQPLRIRARLQSGRNGREKNRASAPERLSTPPHAVKPPKVTFPNPRFSPSNPPAMNQFPTFSKKVINFEQSQFPPTPIIASRPDHSTESPGGDRHEREPSNFGCGRRADRS
jgi:hypothetical protein